MKFFYELANYFNPIYTKIKNIIHKEQVDKLREENRRKRIGKLDSNFYNKKVPLNYLSLQTFLYYYLYFV